MPRIRLLITLLAMLALGTGTACAAGPSGGTSSSMSINSFDVNPVNVSPGQPATLSWSVSGASTVTIDQGVGIVPLSGTKVVTPQATTSYQLTASDGSNNSSARVTISVRGGASSPAGGSNPPPAQAQQGTSSAPAAGRPTVSSFTASPAMIDPGGISTLQWNTAGASSVSIAPAIGTVAPVGTMAVTPYISTPYTLTATNAAGSTTSTVRVMVPTDNSSMLPAVLDFSAQPPVIAIGQWTNLTWNVYKANTITTDPDTGTRMTAMGNVRVSPAENQTYTLSAVNWYGTTTATLDVTVWDKVVMPIHGKPIWVENQSMNALDVMPVITWFTIDPTTMIQGNTAVVNWKTQNATKVQLNGIIVPASGSTVIAPSAGRADSMSMSYTLKATNQWGSYSVAKTITVLNYKRDWFTPFGSNQQ